MLKRYLKDVQKRLLVGRGLSVGNTFEEVQWPKPRGLKYVENMFRRYSQRYLKEVSTDLQED